MKNRVISSIVFILLGAFIILTPTVLFRVCDSAEMKMSCYYTEIVGAAFIVIAAIVNIIYLSRKGKEQ